MKITVKLFATLRENRFAIKDFAIGDNSLHGRNKKLCSDGNSLDGFSEPVTVRNIAESLGISEKEAAIIMVNGRHAEFGHELSGGDVLAIFPPIGGG